jgi:hypothetical protein
MGQEDWEFKASLSYIARPYLKNNQMRHKCGKKLIGIYMNINIKSGNTPLFLI